MRPNQGKFSHSTDSASAPGVPLDTEPMIECLEDYQDSDEVTGSLIMLEEYQRNLTADAALFVGAIRVPPLAAPCEEGMCSWVIEPFDLVGITVSMHRYVFIDRSQTDGKHTVSVTYGLTAMHAQCYAETSGTTVSTGLHAERKYGEVTCPPRPPSEYTTYANVKLDHVPYINKFAGHTSKIPAGILPTHELRLVHKEGECSSFFDLARIGRDSYYRGQYYDGKVATFALLSAGDGLIQNGAEVECVRLQATLPMIRLNTETTLDQARDVPMGYMVTTPEQPHLAVWGGGLHADVDHNHAVVLEGQLSALHLLRLSAIGRVQQTAALALCGSGKLSLFGLASEMLAADSDEAFFTWARQMVWALRQGALDHRWSPDPSRRRDAIEFHEQRLHALLLKEDLRGMTPSDVRQYIMEYARHAFVMSAVSHEIEAQFGLNGLTHNDRLLPYICDASTSLCVAPFENRQSVCVGSLTYEGVERPRRGSPHKHDDALVGPLSRRSVVDLLKTVPDLQYLVDGRMQTHVPIPNFVSGSNNMGRSRYTSDDLEEFFSPSIMQDILEHYRATVMTISDTADVEALAVAISDMREYDMVYKMLCMILYANGTTQYIDDNGVKEVSRTEHADADLLMRHCKVLLDGIVRAFNKGGRKTFRLKGSHQPFGRTTVRDLLKKLDSCIGEHLEKLFRYPVSSMLSMTLLGDPGDVDRTSVAYESHCDYLSEVVHGLETATYEALYEYEDTVVSPARKAAPPAIVEGMNWVAGGLFLADPPNAIRFGTESDVADMQFCCGMPLLSDGYVTVRMVGLPVFFGCPAVLVTSSLVMPSELGRPWDVDGPGMTSALSPSTSCRMYLIRRHRPHASPGHARGIDASSVATYYGQTAKTQRCYDAPGTELLEMQDIHAQNWIHVFPAIESAIYVDCFPASMALDPLADRDIRDSEVAEAMRRSAERSKLSKQGVGLGARTHGMRCPLVRLTGESDAVYNSYVKMWEASARSGWAGPRWRVFPGSMVYGRVCAFDKQGRSLPNVVEKLLATQTFQAALRASLQLEDSGIRFAFVAYDYITGPALPAATVPRHNQDGLGFVVKGVRSDPVNMHDMYMANARIEHGGPRTQFYRLRELSHAADIVEIDLPQKVSDAKDIRSRAIRSGDARVFIAPILDLRDAFGYDIERINSGLAAAGVGVCEGFILSPMRASLGPAMQQLREKIPVANRDSFDKTCQYINRTTLHGVLQPGAFRPDASAFLSEVLFRATGVSKEILDHLLAAGTILMQNANMQRVGIGQIPSAMGLWKVTSAGTAIVVVRFSGQVGLGGIDLDIVELDRAAIDERTMVNNICMSSLRDRPMGAGRIKLDTPIFSNDLSNAVMRQMDEAGIEVGLERDDAGNPVSLFVSYISLGTIHLGEDLAETFLARMGEQVDQRYAVMRISHKGVRPNGTYIAPEAVNLLNERPLLRLLANATRQ
jgi:hypothetical protein